MKDKIYTYKHKLEKELEDYMSLNINEKSATMFNLLVDCLESADQLQKLVAHNCELTEEDVHCWNAKMVNADGTTGGHWTKQQTDSVAQSLNVCYTHITDYDWNVTMNMMYSDYYSVADRFGVNTPEFYGFLAKAFLFDIDGGKPKDKLKEYYYNIVKKAEY